MHLSDVCRSVIHGLSFLISVVIRDLSRYPKLRRRLLQLFLAIFVIWSTADVFLVHRHFNEEQTHLDYKPLRRQRIFIASALWDNERSLPGHWGDVVVDLANVFGSDNLFVSVHETGSSDGTKDALHKFDKKLETANIGRSIAFADQPPDDRALLDLNPADPRRISHIAGLRNKSLRPLFQLRDDGIFFDRILFLSDVFFTKTDVISLLNTNYGTYTAACSFDITKPSTKSDALALRDVDGYEQVMQKWPFFRATESRDPMKYMLPVPVRSCWGGMVFMGTEAIYSSRPIQFRGIPGGLADKNTVASEGCLIHADNPFSKRRGVYLNPFVRVGHSAAEHPAGRSTGHWLSTWQIFESIWENRFRRFIHPPFLEGWSVHSRLSAWVAEDENNSERGDYCLADQTQAMVS